MGKTVNTIIKLFLMFLFFQISINFLVEYLPTSVPNISSEDLAYIDYLRERTNAQLDAEDTGNTLLDNFIESMETEDFFNDSLIDKFLGVLQVIGQMFKFVFQLALSILFTPTLFMQILLYNFIFSSSLLLAISLAVNIFFYMTLWYIINKRRIA